MARPFNPLASLGRAAEILNAQVRAAKKLFAATPLFMGIASIKFKNGDMEAMGKNLGGAVCLFLVPKIVEVLVAWAAQ